MRLQALSIGDMAMVRECELQLTRWGISLELVTREVEKPEAIRTEKRTPQVKKLAQAVSK